MTGTTLDEGTTGKTATPTAASRIHYAIGPIACGMILDAADLITFGPLGLYGGFLIGGLVGFWLASLYRFSLPLRLFWSLGAALYCTMPLTEFVPVATIISAAHRFFHAR